jgi:hypothetical protein
MKNFVLILFFISMLCLDPVFCEEIKIASRVVIVNPNLEFFIFEAGEGDGVEIGDGLIVHRAGKKIGEAYVIEVRPDVSAAEILNIESGEKIQEGDNTLLVKKRRKKDIDMLETETKPVYLTTPEIIGQGDLLVVGIDKDPKVVFFYTIMVLRENGYSILTSNRTANSILANKPIDLSLLKELWADAVAAIDHNIVLSIEIKDEGGLSRLTASSFREHSQKNRYIKRPVVRNSKYYNELVDLVSKIKGRSEY